MITLDGIVLPPYLHWEDEFTWSPVDQIVGHSTTGALLLDISTKQAGRPITLTGTDNLGWITRENLLALQSLSDVPQERELNYHGRTFTVRFRYDSGSPVFAEKIIPRIPPKNTDPYRRLTIKFIIVG